MGSILIVDDDPVTRATVASAVRRFAPGAEPTQAENKRSALSLLADGDLQLAVIDLHLPDGSGLDLLRAVRTSCPEAETLVLTGDQSDQTLRKALKMGASDFLAKPIDLLVLESKVKSLLSKEYRSPLKFLGKGGLQLTVRLNGEARVTALSESELEFLSPIFIAPREHVHIRIESHALELRGTVRTCKPSPGGRSLFVVTAQIDNDLPLTTAGKLRGLLRLLYFDSRDAVA